MLAYCDISYTGKQMSLDYSVCHLFNPIKELIPCYAGRARSIEAGTTHYFILDVGLHLEQNYLFLKDLRKSGIKVVCIFFDPAAFSRVKKYIAAGCIDKCIIFDHKFQSEFGCPTYVSDYFFDEKLFPKVTDKTNNGKVCLFGTFGPNVIQGSRINNYNLDVVDTHISDYRQLYSKIQEYNGVAVFDSGMSEDFKKVVHYNKAKFVEALMCGRNGYCCDGISTKLYEKYKLHYSQIPNPQDIVFDQSEIFDLNRKTLTLLRQELFNI